MVTRFALPFAFAFAALTLGAAAGPPRPLRVGVVAAPRLAGDADDGPRACPPGTLPDHDVCVHIPTGEEEDEGPEAAISPNAHHIRSGRWVAYDEIPRRPERPADYDAYRYPIPPGLPGGHSVVSGYDLDRPDESQRRGWRLHAVGHGGVDLPQAKGTPIQMIALEHQQGDADVLYVGPYFGNTVITRHTVREGGRLRDYLLFFGHMDAPAPGLQAGSVVKEGDLVGTVGDTGSPELVHLHFEVRRMRDGVDAVQLARMGPGRLTQGDASVVCDPRNVLPLK